MSDVERKKASIRMDPEAYLDINGIISQYFGATLESLAKQNPQLAYVALRMAQLSLADQVDIVRNEQGVVAHRDYSGAETPSATARSFVESLMPAVPTAPMRVTVFLFETIGPDGTPLPREHGRQSREELSFDIDPPEV